MASFETYYTGDADKQNIKFTELCYTVRIFHWIIQHTHTENALPGTNLFLTHKFSINIKGTWNL